MERNNNKIVADYLVSKSEMSIDDMGWYVDHETNVPYLNPPFDRSWDMLIHAWHIFTTEQWNKGIDISYTITDFNDCVVRNAPKTACEILSNAILHKSIVKNVSESLKCYDKFGEELFLGDVVDVQQAGQHIIYKKKDGHLYFRPYGEEERVKDYFSNDIIKIRK
jgi:hypothetical protein